MKVVTLLSGGLDSVTLATNYAQAGHQLVALTFTYGQRHEREIASAIRAAANLGARHQVVNLESLTRLLGGSALTDSRVEVPDGHYAEATMKATIVPNRNAIMLSIAYGVAVAEHADLVAFAAHAGDHAIYPDCRPEFVDALHEALRAGNAWADPVPLLHAPFLASTKTDIARLAGQLGVPIADTWSCYRGGGIHCGRCGTCVERQEALHDAGVPDPTEYQDTEFWRQAVADHAAKEGAR